MNLELNYNIIFTNKQGDSYQLVLVHSVEIHKSVELLTDTCSIKIPDSYLNNVYKIPEAILRTGDKVEVWLGYNRDLKKEFEGYVQRIKTDDNTIELLCEDEMYLLRKKVPNKEFKKITVPALARHLLKETGLDMELDATLIQDYDKFVIFNATAFDVLKKIQEDTNANIFITHKNGRAVLNIHPPFHDKGGHVVYSFQQNVEKIDLKYVSADDKRVEIVLTTTGKDGKRIEVKHGDTGGRREERQVTGMSKAAMEEQAKRDYSAWKFDGYEGSITGWLVPYVEPTYTAEVRDAEYPEKDGGYYVSSVTTSFGESGGSRKVQLSKLLLKNAK